MSNLATITINGGNAIPTYGLFAYWRNNYLEGLPKAIWWASDNRYSIPPGGLPNSGSKETTLYSCIIERGISSGWQPPLRFDNQQYFYYNAGGPCYSHTDSIYPHTQQSVDQSFSIMAQVRFSNSAALGKKIIGLQTDVRQAIQSKYDNHIYLGSDGKLRFGKYDTGTNSQKVAVYDITLPLYPAWHHIVATYSQPEKKIRLYVGGVEVASETIDSPDTINGYWCVAGNYINGWPQAQNGYSALDAHSFAVWNVALDATDVQNLYQNTNTWIGK